MLKKITYTFSGLFLMTSLSVSHAACQSAAPVTSSAFCSSFQSAAQCHCTQSGLPSGMCTKMSSIHARMISMFGSLRKACEYQKDVSVQACIDDWNCYQLGGLTSQGELCSGTGRSC